MWYVYILETRKRQLYTGITNDIARRMSAHKKGKGARFTRTFGFKKLRYQEEFPTKSQAQKREAQIKSWPRNKKLALVLKGRAL